MLLSNVSNSVNSLNWTHGFLAAYPEARDLAPRGGRPGETRDFYRAGRSRRVSRVSLNLCLYPDIRNKRYVIYTPFKTFLSLTRATCVRSADTRHTRALEHTVRVTPKVRS